MTKNKKKWRKDFKPLVNSDSVNPPWMSHPIKFVPPSRTSSSRFVLIQGLTCLQMDPEMNLGSFYKCSYTWNFMVSVWLCLGWFEYSLCVKIFSFWLFSCLRSRFSFTSNENGSTLLRDWLRRRPTLNDLGRHLSRTRLTAPN